MIKNKKLAPKDINKEDLEKVELTLKLSWGNYEELRKIYVDFNKCLEDTLEQVCNDYIEDTKKEIDSIL